jgi:hypothetical protein
MLPAVASHAYALVDPAGAMRLSELLRESITINTNATYNTGYKSLADFCAPLGLCARPVDEMTLIAWAETKGLTAKPKTISKYISGIRFSHLTCGFTWPHQDSPLLKMTMASLRKKWPEDDKLAKVPLSLDMLLIFCRAMKGWPNLAALSFRDLVWATASACAFFGALRGGEFFTYPKNLRPPLMASDLKVVASPLERYIRVNIRAPKTRQWLRSEPSFAGSPGEAHELDLVRLYTFMCSERARLYPQKNPYPAFSLADGSPVSRTFMVGHANALRKESGIQIFDTEGNTIPIAAASWRAGYVASARHARVDAATIRAVGRWASASGPMPYSVDSTASIQAACREITLSASDISGLRTSSFAGGQFASSSIIELTGSN